MESKEGQAVVISTTQTTNDEDFVLSLGSRNEIKEPHDLHEMAFSACMKVLLPNWNQALADASSLSSLITDLAEQEARLRSLRLELEERVYSVNQTPKRLKP